MKPITTPISKLHKSGKISWGGPVVGFGATVVLLVVWGASVLLEVVLLDKSVVASVLSKSSVVGSVLSKSAVVVSISVTSVGSSLIVVMLVVASGVIS